MRYRTGARLPDRVLGTKFAAAYARHSAGSRLAAIAKSAPLALAASATLTSK